MKLIRVGERGKERPAVLLPDGRALDVSSRVRDFDGEFFENGGVDRLRALSDPGLPRVDLSATRLGPPIARPWKAIGIGLNYADHARESGSPIPREPVIFMKASNSVSGPDDDILLPRGGDKTDWEVELGVVLGRTARYLPDEAAAAACIAGYCVAGDISERGFQLERGGQWDKGKSCETFCPLGPWLVTPDEIADPQDLDLLLEVNGRRMQSGNTRTMIFSVRHLIWYLSQMMVLEPGDVLLTGTPPGVGLGMKPPRYLREGDVVELEIRGLGRQRHLCRRA